MSKRKPHASKRKPHDSPGSSPSATLPDVTSIVVPSGFLPPRELFRFARSSKAVTESLADIDLWKLLCIARLGGDAVDKLHTSGFANSVGKAGGSWERLFRALVTQGQFKDKPLGKDLPPDQWDAKYEAIPKSYSSGIREPLKSLNIPSLSFPRHDYCVITQIVKEDDVTGAALYASALPVEDLTKQQREAFFMEGKASIVEIPADGVVPKEKVTLQKVEKLKNRLYCHYQECKVTFVVHLIRKTDGKICCICETCAGDYWPTRAGSGLSVTDEIFDGLPLSLKKEGRDYIGCFNQEIVDEMPDDEGRFWYRFLAEEDGVSLCFRVHVEYQYDSDVTSEKKSSNLTDLNLLGIKLAPQLYMGNHDGMDEEDELTADFLPMKYTSGSISTAHFLEQLTGWT